MNRDQIERALRDPGPREAGYVERPLQLGSTGPRTWWFAPMRVASFGAVVVAGVVVALVLTRGSLFGPTPPGAGTATPTASAANPNRACTIRDLAWTADPWGGAAGSVGTSVTIRGVASLTGCRIDGSARLVLRDANGKQLVAGEGASSSVDVKAGDVFQMGIMWSNWCSGEPAAPLSLDVTLPHDSPAVSLVASGLTSAAPCNGAGQSSSLSGTTFQPPPQG